MFIRDNHVYLGGVSAVDLAKEFGTPLFVIEEDVLRQQYRFLLRVHPASALSPFLRL